MEWASQYTDANVVKTDFFEASLRSDDLAARESKKRPCSPLGLQDRFLKYLRFRAGEGNAPGRASLAGTAGTL
ncbi:hypothetical protein JQM63_08700 [Oscillibacter valericigenes]|nr:hypothetical protein [Oscillibacter valericigenes]